MADGMSFRGCLSGGGDIFSKSVEKQGGANRTFATGGRCHGWQLEPCPCGLEPLLTFRQKIPTGRPYIEEGHSVRHGRSWICFTNSQFCNLYHQSRKYVYGVQILWKKLNFLLLLSFRKYIKIPWITLPRHAPTTAPAMVIPSIST